MSFEVWGDEPWDGPELPEGWWNDDTVKDVQDAINALCAETVYEDGKKDNGVSERFLARLTILRATAMLVNYDDPLVRDAERVLTPNN